MSITKTARRTASSLESLVLPEPPHPTAATRCTRATVERAADKPAHRSSPATPSTESRLRALPARYAVKV
jgi:hypothetical protein